MKSTDGGSVWTVSGTLYDNYGDVITDPNNNSVFWTGGNGWNGSAYVPIVSVTDDVGETWTQCQLSDSNGMINCLVVHPSNSDIIFAGGYSGSFPAIFETADAGSTWTDVSSGITGVVNDIVIDPDCNEIMYAGTDAGVCKSLDAGTTWINVGLTYVNDLLIDPLNSTTVIAATNSGVFTTTNAGRDWQAMNDGLDTVAVMCLGIHPNVYLYAGTYGSGLYKMDWVFGAEDYVDNSVTKKVFIVHPNPMRDHMTFSYALSHEASIRLAIYDVQGRLVHEFTDTDVEAGWHAHLWNGQDIQGHTVAAGVYFCMLTLGSEDHVEKIVVVR